MNESLLVLYILIGFPIAFSFIWCMVMAIISVVGGWKKLGDDYATDDPANVDWIGWQTARLGIIDYKTCLWIAVSERGLFLKTGPSFFFRFMHPPLLIPWKDVKELQEKNLLMFTYAGMKINGVNVLLPNSLMDKLKKNTQPYSS